MNYFALYLDGCKIRRQEACGGVWGSILKYLKISLNVSYF